MRSILRMTAIAAAILLAAVLALAQAPAATPAEVQVKDTPASQSLAKLVADHKADAANLNTAFQQARGSLDANAKALNDEAKKANDDLQAKLKEDKKYKPLIEHIQSIEKQLQDLNAKANGDYQKAVGPVQNKIQLELAQIQGLIPVVRKENDLPETANFDVNTGKWTLPAKK